METEKILMGQRQLQRWHLMKMVEGREDHPEGGRREDRGVLPAGEAD